MMILFSAQGRTLERRQAGGRGELAVEEIGADQHGHSGVGWLGVEW